MADEVADIITVANAALQYGDSTLGEAAHRILSQFPITGTVNPTTEPDDTDTEQRSEPESFEFLNELALAFRRGEKNARPQHTPVLEGIRAVLAHLTAAGRLIPAGGMALTAEQVEDVRIVLGLNGSQDIKVVLDAQARLRALLPATEPAEVNGNLSEIPNSSPAPAEPAEDAKPCGSNSVTLGWCKLTARHEGLHTNGTYLWGTASEPDPPALAEPAEAIRDGSDLVVVQRSHTAKAVQSWMTLDLWTYLGKNDKDFDAEYERQGFGDLWATLLGEVRARIQSTTPAPAEPAEEETKAEGRDPDALAKRLAWIWHDGWDACGERERGCLRRAAEMAHSHYTSSPVVPAPTETGPWQRIEDVPESVGRLTDRDGDDWEWDGDNWVTPNAAILPTTYINRNFAPFVAAKEG